MQFSISRHATIVSKRNKLPPPPPPLSTVPLVQCCFDLTAQVSISSVAVNNIVIGEGGKGLLICDCKHFCQGKCKYKYFYNVSQQVFSEVVGLRLL